MNKTNMALIAGQITAMSLLMWGCKTLDLSKYDVPIPTKPVTTTTTTSTTTTTQPAVNVGVNYTSANDFNWADAEEDNSVYSGGVEVRCLVNDNMMGRTADHGSDAWITKLSRDSGGMMFTANADGSVTLIGNDFVTSHNKYHFEGWRISSSSKSLVAKQSITLSGNDKDGTTRGYWRTVK